MAEQAKSPLRKLQKLKFEKDILPDITREGVGIILMSEWLVNGSEEQIKAADAVIQVWKQFPWPEGLLSYNCYLSIDSNYLMHYLQWKDEGCYQQFIQNDALERENKIEETLQIEQRMSDKFHLYRSAVSKTSEVPGCIVIVVREYGTPEITAKFIDTAFQAIKAEEQEWAGPIAAHFHISINSTVTVNYAEWASEQAYQRFVEQSNKDTFIGLSPLWKKVREFPYKPITASFKKYRFYRSILNV